MLDEKRRILSQELLKKARKGTTWITRQLKAGKKAAQRLSVWVEFRSERLVKKPYREA